MGNKVVKTGDPPKEKEEIKEAPKKKEDEIYEIVKA
jgi:hypothetical protein